MHSQLLASELDQARGAARAYKVYADRMAALLGAMEDRPHDKALVIEAGQVTRSYYRAKTDGTLPVHL